MIKLQVIGHLGRDCVVNDVNNKPVINFSVAHSEKYKDAQGVQHDKTTWVDCSYWSERTSVAPYLKQGTQVFVEGTPDVRTYQTRDGKQGTSLSLRVVSVQLLGGNKDNQNGQSQNRQQPSNNQPQYQNSDDIKEPDDDLPF